MFIPMANQEQSRKDRRRNSPTKSRSFDSVSSLVGGLDQGIEEKEGGVTLFEGKESSGRCERQTDQ